MKKAKSQALPATDPNLDYLVGLSQAERESRAGDERLASAKAKKHSKRTLRIVKRVRNVPVLGICEYCNAQFSGDPNAGNSESAIQKQFNAHDCKPVNGSQAVAQS
jgi:hypothetical protein